MTTHFTVHMCLDMLYMQKWPPKPLSEYHALLVAFMASHNGSSECVNGGPSARDNKPIFVGYSLNRQQKWASDWKKCNGQSQAKTVYKDAEAWQTMSFYSQSPSCCQYKWHQSDRRCAFTTLKSWEMNRYRPSAGNKCNMLYIMLRWKSLKVPIYWDFEQSADYSQKMQNHTNLLYILLFKWYNAT